MPMMKSVLGLDAGSHSLKAVELVQTLRGLESGQMRLDLRAEAAGDEQSDPLGAFVRMHRLPTEHVVCAIRGDRLSSRELLFPFHDRKKLAAAIPFELDGKIIFNLEDIVIDWDIINTVGKTTHVIANLTRREEVARTLHEFRSAGIEPRVIEAEGLVLGNLAAVFDLPGTRLLADLGHQKTTLCLLVDGHSVASTSIPIAGLALTRAIAKARGLELDAAEAEKCERGIFEGITGPVQEAVAVLDRLAREIVRFLESQHERLQGAEDSYQIDEVTILGGTSKLAGIADYLGERTGMPVRPLGMAPDSLAAQLFSAGDPVLFAPAIALALRATAQTRTRMNFRQDELAYRTDLRQYFVRDLRSTALLAAAVAAIALASFTSSIYVKTSYAGRLEDQSARLYSEAFPGQSSSNPVPDLSRALHDARDRADFLGIYTTNLSALDLLAELSSRIPPDLEVRFEDININRRVVKVKVIGETYEAADRLKNLLAESAPFTNAEVDKVKTQRRGLGKTFNLTISLSDEREPIGETS